MATVALAAVLSGVTGAVACEYNVCAPIEFGLTVDNTLRSNYEAHGYYFAADRMDVLLLRANKVSGTINPQITLMRPNGDVLAVAGIPGTGVADIVDRLLEDAGGYTLVVRDVDGYGKGDYALSIQSARGNGLCSTITYDQIYRDSLAQISEMNVYRFAGNVGDQITVFMLSLGGIEPNVRLYDPAGRRLAIASGRDNAVITGQVLPFDGTYTIIARDNIGTRMGAYQIMVYYVGLDADDQAAHPLTYALSQNRPNPFNPQTTIDFSLPRASRVTLEVFDILGGLVRTLTAEDMPAGSHQVIWDGLDSAGRPAASGIYLYRLEAGEFSQTRKMVLLK
jgi:hypothetical protein